MEHEIKINYDSLKSAQAEAVRLTAELKRMMEAEGSSVEEMQRLQDELTEVRKSISDNADEFTRWANVSAGDLSEAISKSEFAVNQLNDTVSANKEIIAGLQEDYDNAKKGLEELTAQVEEFDKTKLELEELKQLKADLDGDKEASAEASAKIDELTAKLAELSPKLEDVNSKIQQKTDKMAETQKALEREKANLAENTKAQTQMQTTLDRTKREYDNMTARIQQNNEKLKESTQSFQNVATKMFQTVGLGGGLVGLFYQARAVRAEMQNMEAAMETMMGKDLSKGIMADLTQLAKQTPLAMTDMVGAEKLMVSFGLDAKDSVKYIKAISDISGGSSAQFNSLSLAFSQMSAAGKLMGQDLMQMINQGFNPLEEMSRKTGKTIGQLKDEMSKGAISAKMVQDAFMSATQEGGKFFGMSEAGAATIDGQLSMLEDAWGSVMNELGTWIEDFAKGALSVSTTLVDNWQKLVPIILGVAAAYGASKVAEMMAIAAEKELAAQKAKTMGVTIASTGAETARGTALSFSTLKTMLATKAQAAFNAVAAACPYVAIAAGIAALGYAFYMMAVEGKEYEKAQGAMNDRMAEAEVQTKKDTAELKFLCDEYRKASDAVNGLNNAQENGADNTERLENQTEATEGLTGATRQETEAERQRTGAVREGSQTTDEATQATEGHTGAVETETGALEDNSDANETNEERQKKLNTTKGEIIALASKYKVELDEEQLKIENLASTYDTLAKRISDVNKAKAVMSIRDEAQAQMDSAVSTGAQQINSTFAKKVRTDDKSVDELEKAITVQSEGTEAYTAIMDAIKSGALKLDASDYSGLTNDLKDQMQNSSGAYEGNLERIMGKITESVGAEQAQKFKAMLDIVADSSWYEGEFHDFSEQLFTAMRDASAYQRNMAATDKLAEELKPTIDDLNKKEEKVEVKHNLSEIVQRIKEAQGEITKLRQKMQSGDFTDEDIKQLEEWQKKEDAAKKEYKQATGKDYGATKDSAKKLKEAELNLEKELYNLRKQEQNMEKQALQYQMGKTESLIEQKNIQDKILEIEREQAIEDLKRQEAEKLRQIKERKDLNAKDKETLTRKTKELYEGKEGATGAEGVGMIGMKEREFNAKASQQNMEFLKKQQDQLKGLLGTYGDHYDKRQALLEKYEKERRKFLESGGSEDSVEYKNFEKARKKELTDLDKGETFTDDEWEKAMEVENAIEKIADEAVVNGTEAMMDAIRQFIQQAEAEKSEVEDEIAEAKKKGDNTAILKAEEKRATLQKTINVAKSRELELQKDIAKRNGKSTKEIEKQNEKFEKTKKIVGLVSEAMDTLGDVVSDDARKYVDMVKTIADATMSVINSIQSYTQAVNTAIEESAKTSSESVKTVEKASVILAVIGAAIQVATKIASMFSKGNDTSALVQQWHEVAGIYSEMAGAQQAIMQNARTSEQATEAAQKQIDLLKKQNEAEKEAARQRAENRSKNAHSTGYRINSMLEGAEWQNAFANLGMGIKSWEDTGVPGFKKLNSTNEWSELLDQDWETLKKLKEEYPQLWSQLDGEFKGCLENIIDIGEQGEEAAQQLQDKFAGITLDGLKDSATDLFMNMDAGATDFTDTIANTLKTNIATSTIEKEFGKEMEQYQKKLADANKDGISAKEAERLMQEGKDLNERINARKLELAEEYGKSGLYDEQTADDNTVTTGTFAEMSEATANALEGRFTAVYESNLRIESAVTANGGMIGTIATINSSMAEQIAQNANTYTQAEQETQRILAESLLELKGINENGGNVLKILKVMAGDLADVKTSTAKL